MKFHVVTLFPEVIDAYAGASILARAQKAKLLEVKSYQLRDFALNPKKTKGSKQDDWFYKRTDDKPYGGGPGMVLQAEPFIRAVEAIQKKETKKGKLREVKLPAVKVLITVAGGKPLTNAYAKNLTKKYSDVIILCGRYEGIDARVKKILKAEEVSVGPYILTGGELPALTIIDTAARQIKGVLGKFESLEESRVASHEIYTRPETFTHKGKKYSVPKVLLSGHHANMDAWKDKKRSNPSTK
ncbi:MAG TPA: tRNA (guanosine(37)-N1)-methyltransferase TrmD [Candidatus Paceibacterota bacterium]|nr:tRNA (guanosine(37)-N1)-methyltransferase TrmD [Candidatus Paceibacterota bacterium]